jgi:hypothetical protein
MLKKTRRPEPATAANGTSVLRWFLSAFHVKGTPRKPTQRIVVRAVFPSYQFFARQRQEVCV